MILYIYIFIHIYTYIYMYINTDQYILWFISQLITERGGHNLAVGGWDGCLASQASQKMDELVSWSAEKI